MTITLTIHTHGQSLTVKSERPANNCSIAICQPDQIEIDVFGSLEMWWHLRQFPKADGYYYFLFAGTDGIVRDHARADELALEFYNAERAKLLATPIAETDIGEVA